MIFGKQNENVLSQEAVQYAFNVFDGIRNMSYSYGNFDSLCYRRQDSGKCLIQGVVEFWDSNSTKVNIYKQFVALFFVCFVCWFFLSFHPFVL